MVAVMSFVKLSSVLVRATIFHGCRPPVSAHASAPAPNDACASAV